jgi:hypothetical protein
MEINMSFESRITEKALMKNTKMPDNVNYAKSLARSMEELETFEVFIKWLNLDVTNRTLLAEELGVTNQELGVFLAINKAVYNGNKVDREDIKEQQMTEAEYEKRMVDLYGES